MIKTLFSTIAIALSLVTSAASADPVDGPIVDRDILGAFQTVTYSVLLTPDEVTAFRIVGDDDGDLDCRLINSNGRVVDSDFSSDDGCVFRVQPSAFTIFTLWVRNSGSTPDLYNLRIW